MILHDEGRAGQFLKAYEGKRYTFLERNLRFLDIIIQPDAEQFADVSFYQANMNWDEYRLHARAVILRIGQNVWKDSEFEYNYENARRVGCVLGGYFFFDGRASPQQQADVIIAAMRGKHFEMELLIDWERNYGGAYEGLPNVVSLMQKVEAAGVQCKAVGMYTGYYYFTEHSNASANAAQYTYLRQRPLHLAWYASAYLVRVPPPWADWTHWQLGTPVVEWGQPTRELDMNKHNGTRAQFTARYVGTVEPPPADVIHTIPAPGVDEYIEIVNGEKCHISVINMAGKRFRVRHFGGALGYVSQAAREDHALIAFNGQDYDLDALIKYYPKSLAYTDGQLYTHQAEFQYWMNVSRENGLSADFRLPPPFWNATSFVRPLVLGGQTAPDIIANPNKIEYTEIHACSGLGYAADGKIIQIVAEGKVDPATGIAYRGITVPQLVMLFVKYGAWFAGQQGGGGDSGKAINGIMVNEPSDPVERPVVEVIEIFGTQETGETMYQGKAGAGAKLWRDYAGGILSNQITPPREGDTVQGDAPSDGVVRLTSPVGYTKTQFLVDYHLVTVTPPPVEPPPTELETTINITLKSDHTVTGTWTEA